MIAAFTSSVILAPVAGTHEHPRQPVCMGRRNKSDDDGR